MRRHNIAGIILVLIGISILFSFPFFNIIFALILVWIGINTLTGKRRWGNFGNENEVTSSEKYLSRVFIFSGMRAKLTSKDFEGMDLTAIFSAAEVDASVVSTKSKELDIELVAIFGGVKVKFPKNWSVKSEGVGILGGFDNNTKAPAKPTVTVHLKGTAILGGVEVLN